MCANEEDCFDSFDTAHACTVTHPALIALRKMQRFTARIDRSMAATLRAHDINPAQLTLLRSIGASEGLTHQQLAEAIGLSRANISQLLDFAEADQAADAMFDELLWWVDALASARKATLVS